MDHKHSDKFQIQIFKQILWIMAFVAVTNIVGNIFTGYTMSANIKWVLVIIAAYITDEFGFRSEQKEKMMFILITLIVYTVFPMGWYNSGLIANNAIAYMFLLVVGSTILFEGGRRIFLLVSISALFLVFMLAEYYFPELLPVYDPVLLFRDKMIQVPLSVLITSSMLIQFSNTLKNRQEALEALSDEFKEMAYSDSLTGLGNRTYIFEKIETLIVDQQSFCTLMLDLDDFKKVNDTYGHIDGDDLLKRVASLLKEHLPTDSHLARYGGDEFIVVMLRGEEVVVEMINNLLEAIREDTDFLKYGTTISGGYRFYESGKSLDEYLREVDLTLYSAKGNGKNQILAEQRNL